jgi:2,4-didehydro-3-deoxy-L-rhamnonate hydrolase
VLATSEAPFALGRFDAGHGPFTGVVARGQVAAAADLLPDWEDGGIEAFFADWHPRIAALGKRLAAGGPHRVWGEHALRRLPPVQPPQVFLAGMNYRTHVVELLVDQRAGSRERMSADEIRAEATELMDARARSGTPLVFSGLPSSICGPDDDVHLRPDSEQNDWELELAAVIGQPARRVAREDALSCVAGWTIANDLTARDLIARTDSGPVTVDWLRAKLSPTYLPVGPYVVPSQFVLDPQTLRLTLRLNGETMQDESTADMVFDVATLVAYCSEQAQLLPGDLLLTGSPAGNGTHHGRFLRDGDVLEGEITGLGVLRNRCVAAA